MNQDIKSDIYWIMKDSEVPYEGVDISEASEKCYDYIQSIIEKKNREIAALKKGNRTLELKLQKLTNS